jgi:hypothetical protein
MTTTSMGDKESESHEEAPATSALLSCLVRGSIPAWHVFHGRSSSWLLLSIFVLCFLTFFDM